jgi:cullin 3
MVVLLQFNEKITLSYQVCVYILVLRICCIYLKAQVHPTNNSLQEIAELSGIEEMDLRRTLQGLSLGKTKVLIKSTGGNHIRNSDSFTFNEGLSDRRYRIRIGQVSCQNPESEPERERTLGRLEEERSHLLDATLVRIMKARKAFSHAELVAEATSQLSARFMPPPNLVKRRIEALLDREFISRSLQDPSVYEYVA